MKTLSGDSVVLGRRLRAWGVRGHHRRKETENQSYITVVKGGRLRGRRDNMRYGEDMTMSGTAPLARSH
jgi:hypothetical protein